MKKAKDLLGKVFTETVTERIGDSIVASTVQPSTLEEIKEAMRLHKKGQCKHNIVIDESFYLYDIRTCAICGRGLGAI